jgi:uncharacterized lipoprotein YddW (UPF0748 family)
VSCARPSACPRDASGTEAGAWDRLPSWAGLVGSLLLVTCGGSTGKGAASTDGSSDGTAERSATSGDDSANERDTSKASHIVALTLSPATVGLVPGQEMAITATAIYDDNREANVSGRAAWFHSGGAIDVVVRNAAKNDVVVRALTDGTADVTAQVDLDISNTVHVVVSPAVDSGVDSGVDERGGSDTGNQTDAAAEAGAREVRAVWVTRFSYSDADDVRAVINKAADAGFNVVFFQVRGAGDAFYASTYEPWAKGLSGTLGKNPGWDPLATAITVAHSRGIELHAYVNVFTAWSCSSGCTCRAEQGVSNSCSLPEASATGAPTHYLRAHPTSMAVDTSGLNKDTEYFWFSPADSAYRAHVLGVLRELLTNYNVDGLHLDRIRYPGTWASYDPASTTAWETLPNPKPEHANWQRENVSSMVGAIYDEVKAVRPKAVLSAAVWGIYQRLPSCTTSQGYADYFQDSLNWLSTSRIDWLVPMIYWDIGSGCTDWSRLLDGFVAGGNSARVVAGTHALDSSTFQPTRIKARISYARQIKAAGTCIFASSYLDSSSGWGTFSADGGVYEEPAVVPAMTWR